MTLAAVTHDDDNRVRALRSLQLLDSPPDERFDRITRLAQALFGTPMAAVTLVDAERVWHKSRIGLKDAESPRATSFCGHVVHDARPLVVEDALQDPRFHDNPNVTGDPHVRFYAGHPVHAMGHLLGSFGVADTQPRGFTDADRSHLADLAALVERELACAESATTDPLTGLLNRRGFELVAKQCLNHIERDREAACLLSIDLDGFRQINDALGREQGDDALRQFAGCLTQTFRVCDVVARLGGDEFVVLLSAAGLADVPPALARLQRHVDGVNRRAGVAYGLRFSAGSSVVISSGAVGLREALQQADEQLVARKRERA
ncbi:sensor domain-containing diguanylate cyclase [Aquincola sp. S2]|uniref:Sensor domain-containing diguanylate cyclase n=1 Tax=Pseudaquabacterium terrae TaxID=2732868 RepID=A0ABX2EM76_9BURK|nr:sensor domain-containing diguanylate cyclase [Aquabacterium terrae]NRF69754.1 sensor domain-containing diguanylate cyclase [Aquabacterium terrae]